MALVLSWDAMSCCIESRTLDIALVSLEGEGGILKVAGVWWEGVILSNKDGLGRMMLGYWVVW